MKTEEKLFETRNHSQVVAGVLTGLAIGTVVWLLFGTKGGRKQLNCAVDHLHDFTSVLKDKARDGAEHVSVLAGKAVKEAGKLQETGKAAMDKAGRLAHEAADKAQKAAKKAGNRIAGS